MGEGDWSIFVPKLELGYKGLIFRRFGTAKRPVDD